MDNALLQSRNDEDCKNTCKTCAALLIIINPHSLMMTCKRRVQDDRVLLNFTNRRRKISWLPIRSRSIICIILAVHQQYIMIAYYAQKITLRSFRIFVFLDNAFSLIVPHHRTLVPTQSIF